MSRTLIIAEKPSVALDLSRVLGKLPDVGKLENKKDYFENDKLVISSAVGHLVELCMPNEQGGKKLKWDFEHLPIMPDEFDLQPISDNESRLKLLIRLMKKKDVSRIVNACDAGREGELIFRYLVQVAGVEKPTERMWMQSMTRDAITEAWKNLRTDESMVPLAHAAMCRSESDWLVGINCTRALTAYNSRYGGFSKTPVGRVKTPTLAIIVAREKLILDFDPRDYFEVHADFGVSAGSYPGRWLEESWKKNEDEHDKAERLWNREEAEAIVERCLGKQGEVEEKTRPQKQAPPPLYDLTLLQREASNRFGFSARRTLQLAQALYERHKVLTYPRTDSRHLPEDYIGTVKGTMGNLQKAGAAMPSGLDKHAGTVLQQNWVKSNKRIFDNAKISDHFAIIPTGQIPPKSLNDAELKLYTMVSQRFVATFFPNAEFEITTRITRIGQDAFQTNGKVMIVPGWRAVYGPAGAGDKEMVAVQGGEKPLAEDVRVEDKVTRPPARYSEATLLSAMEGAEKLVDDEELRDAMSERGLGTPATRAATIEGLISDKYMVRAEKELVPTQSGIKLIDEISDIGIDLLKSPEMTGQWEYKLKEMERGKMDRPSFMREIRTLTTDIVDRVRVARDEARNKEFDPLEIECPECGHSPLKQDEGSYRCTNCKFTIWKTVAARELSEEEIRELLTKRFIGPLTGFRSKRGQDFDAGLEVKEGKVSFVFEKSEQQEKEAKETNREDNVIATCPICQSTVHETETAWVCKNNADGNCKGRLSRELCKRALTTVEAREFFEKGRTPVITDFISKRGRPFTASLVANPTGRRFMNFEFPPREGDKEKAGQNGAPKKKAATKKKSARKKSAKKKTAKKKSAAKKPDSQS